MHELKTPFCALLLLFLGPLAGCGDHDHDHAGGDPAEHGAGHAHGAGPHGGAILDVGAGVAHLEVVVDEEGNELTLWLLGGDAETPRPIEGAPVLKLLGAPAPLAGEALGASERAAAWRYSGEGLDVRDLEGRVTLELEGRVYNVPIERRAASSE